MKGEIKIEWGTLIRGWVRSVQQERVGEKSNNTGMLERHKKLFYIYIHLQLHIIIAYNKYKYICIFK